MRPERWSDDWPLVDGADGNIPSYWAQYEDLRDELESAVDFYERCLSEGVKGMYANYIRSIRDKIDALC
jgi:hypothetical protein